jgi:metal-responsive CopG/Arc/MetJ family transcriptional regulator
MQPETPPQHTQAIHTHCQVTLRLPKSVLRSVDALAQSEFSTRAAVIRRLVYRSLCGERGDVPSSQTFH